MLLKGKSYLKHVTMLLKPFLTFTFAEQAKGWHLQRYPRMILTLTIEGMLCRIFNKKVESFLSL